MIVTTELAEEILAGLRAAPRRLPCKLLYDEVGSALFESICRLPEYYPTRTEIAILQRHLPEMAAAIGPGVEVVEFGSGSGRKTSLLLEALERPTGLCLIEISASALAESLERLRRRFPALPVRSVQGDYTSALRLPPADAATRRRLVFFPGSTIGNFAPEQAIAFLARTRRLVGGQGLLLLGTDQVKDPALLEAAYDDRAGVTAAFNRNLLQHCNCLLDGDCDPERFAHRAPWDAQRRRIDMLLMAREDLAFTLAGERITMRAGEHIHTEHCHKFRPEDVATMARVAGWRVDHSWYDDAAWFGVHLLRPA